MPVEPGHANPYGDPDVNPMTGERYPHLDEEPKTPPTDEDKPGKGPKEVANGVGEGQ